MMKMKNTIVGLFVGAMIRDNLTLNVLMFIWPLDSVLHWQQGR